MLTIRFQRTGRSGHAQFRVVVQDSRFSPTSGRVVAQVGSYNPHTKTLQLDKDKVAGYLANGAQPSDRAAKLLKSEGVKLPDWFKVAPDKKREARNPDKFNKDAPKPSAKADEATEGETPAETAEAPAETPEAPAEEAPVPEAPNEEVKEPLPAQTLPEDSNSASDDTKTDKVSAGEAEKPAEEAPAEPVAEEAPTEPEKS